MEVFEHAKSGAGLRLVNGGRKPFGPKELLTIGYCSVFAAAEVDCHVVYTICMNNYKIFMSGLRRNARRIEMTELYS